MRKNRKSQNLKYKDLLEKEKSLIRFKIIKILDAGPKNAHQLAQDLDKAYNTIIYHLKKLIENNISLPEAIMTELIDTSRPARIEGREPSKEELELIKWILTTDAGMWFSIARWGKLTKTLESWEKSISFSIGRFIARGREPSVKQARQGKKIYEKAIRMGFTQD